MGTYVLFLLRQEKYQKNAAKVALRVALPRAKYAPFGNPSRALSYFLNFEALSFNQKVDTLFD